MLELKHALVYHLDQAVWLVVNLFKNTWVAAHKVLVILVAKYHF